MMTCKQTLIIENVSMILHDEQAPFKVLYGLIPI